MTDSPRASLRHGIQASFGHLIRTSSLAIAMAAAAGCASNPVNWTIIEPHSASPQSTVVGINPQGALWFFQCEGQNMMTGLRIGAVAGPQAQLQIKLDAEPAEASLWQVENKTYVMRGEPATLLARRAALAYNAIIEVDGKPVKFALTGSHSALIHMTEDCPFLAVE